MRVARTRFVQRTCHVEVRETPFSTDILALSDPPMPKRQTRAPRPPVRVDGHSARGYVAAPMFPYRDVNPAELMPVVTVGLIALNVAAWLFVQGVGLQLEGSVCEF